jgi:uncharacterized membrane protein YkgB
LKYNKKFIYDFKNYKIVAENLAKPIAYLIVFSEILVGITLVIGFYKRFAYIGGFLLFLVFSMAMIINLAQKNKIQCGCGGLVGDTIISWRLVIRNFIFMSVFIYLFVQDKLYANSLMIFLNHSGNIDFNTVISLLSIIPTFLISITLSNILNVKRQLLDYLK